MADEPICFWETPLMAKCPVHGGPLVMCPIRPAEVEDTLVNFIADLRQRENKGGSA